DDCRDLAFSQRPIVLVLADADRLVEMPRRHLAIGHALPDRSRPRADVLIGGKRHRRRRTGVMTALATSLKNRRHVFCKRDGLWIDCRLPSGTLAGSTDSHLH